MTLTLIHLNNYVAIAGIVTGFLLQLGLCLNAARDGTVMCEIGCHGRSYVRIIS